MEVKSNSIRFLYTLIIGVLLTIISGGGTNSYSQLFILLFTGGMLVVFPPKHLPGKWIVGACTAMVVWILITILLPLPFSGAQSFIKEIAPGFIQGKTVSVQPYLSFEKSVYFIVGLSWLFLVMDRPLDHYSRTKCFRMLSWGLSVLGAITLAGLLLKFQHPFTWGTHKFSFFPNHNQSGAVLAIGAIFVMGMIMRSIKRRSWEVLLYMLCFAVLTFAIVLGMSRSSILILIAGCLLNILLTLEKKNYKFYVKLGAPFFIILVAIFVLYGGRLLDEFLSLLKEGGVQEEMRLLIYADVLKLIANFPVVGVGLGNFRYLFPLFQDYATTVQAIHHPESDFLWIWCELGLIGTLILLAGLILLFLRLDPVDIVKTKGVRLMGFVSLVMFLVAGIVEVSGHRLGTALLAIVIFGLSQPNRAKLHTSGILPYGARFIGLSFLVIATLWIIRMSKGELSTKEDVHEFYNQPFTEIIGQTTAEEAISNVSNWIKRYPLFAELHEVKGRLLLQENAKVDEAEKCFVICQKLEPENWKNHIYHGIFLHSFDFDLAMSHWYKGIEISGEDNVEAFDLILRNVDSKDYPKLRDLTYSDKDLQFEFYSKIRGSRINFSREFGLELAINPELQGFSSEQKQALLWAFTELNGPEMLKRLLDKYPVLGSENWTVKAQMEAGVLNYKEASRLAVMNLPRPEMIDLTRDRSLSSIRREYMMDADDLLKAVALIQKQEKDGMYRDALVSIQVARRKGMTNEYLEFSEALMNFYLCEYKDSWKVFERIIHSSIEW